jgi:hypothetical protein
VWPSVNRKVAPPTPHLLFAPPLREALPPEGLTHLDMHARIGLEFRDPIKVVFLTLDLFRIGDGTGNLQGYFVLT